MADIFLLIFLLSIIGLFLGIIKPSIIKLASRKTALKIFIPTLFVSFALFGVTADSPDQIAETSDSEKQVNSVTDKNKNDKSSQEKSSEEENNNDSSKSEDSENKDQTEQNGASNSSDNQINDSNQETDSEYKDTGERATNNDTSEDETKHSNTKTSNKEEEQTNKKEESSDNQTTQETDDSNNSDLTRATVTRIVDGDTIEIKLNGKIEGVRLLLVDTPETKHPSKPVQPFGPEASAFAKEKLTGKQVRVEYDGPKRDKYNRLLAYLWVDGQNFNQMLLEEGLARLAYVYDPPYTHYNAFVKAQTRATNAGIGIWSMDGYVQSDGFHYEKPKDEQSQEEQQKEDTSNDVSSSYDGPYDPKGEDRNCSDFDTHDEAQAFFKAAGGPNEDPHGLDRDKDGLVCESLP
ncbi:thermonuclease family protein [Gracilibacillus sp. YIM 98692]|uniref:thermonuclease family protein n=1 Tax=Gracilibacillus sp. YIM 98692 TaxID=2663532 RepID=UPI001F097487|nr:thermonuclease family protein [Gracilibacillus sp. YIM 98692]